MMRDNPTAESEIWGFETIDAGKGPVRSCAAYPVQVWRIGSQCLFIALGGKVVVDYVLRLKDELGPQRTWVAGCSNNPRGRGESKNRSSERSMPW
ncbi:MAG: hypothetical protein ACYTG0_31055 [Planctomycetota bacterium]|jgi:hypothetical protein